MSNKITVYECEFCPKHRLYRSRRAARKHESMCYWNPATRSCMTCRDFDDGGNPPCMAWRRSQGLYGSMTYTYGCVSWTACGHDTTAPRERGRKG